MADQPVWNSADKDAGCTLSNSDKTATQAGSDAGGVRSTIGRSTGKWYVEFSSTATMRVALATSAAAIGSRPGDDAFAWALADNNGNKVNNGSSTAYGTSWTSADRLGMAIDLVNGKVYWSKNGTYYNSGDPAAGTGAAFTGLSGTFYLMCGKATGSAANITLVNIASYSASPPTGFVAGWGGSFVSTQAVTATSTVTAAIVRTVNKLQSATSTVSASIQRITSKFLAATSTVSATVLKTVSTTLSALSTVTATLTTATLRQLALTATSTVSALMQRTTSKFATATSTVDAAIQKVVSKTLDVTSVVDAALTKAFGLTLSATSTVSASITKTISTTLSAASTVTADMLRAAVFGVTMAVTSTVTAVMEAVRTAFVTMEAISAATATISRVVSITMSVAVPAVTRPIQWVAHMFAAIRNDKANWNQCARCLTKTRPNKLLRQMEFVGQRERWTGLYVCNLCIDDPQPQNITPRTLGGDPRPVPNARPRKD